MTTRPDNMEKTEDSVYSNIDHKLDKEVKQLLLDNPGKLYAQHDAWDFCGYIWFKDGTWYEEIWRYHSLREVIQGPTVEGIIEDAILRYGSA